MQRKIQDDSQVHAEILYVSRDLPLSEQDCDRHESSRMKCCCGMQAWVLEQGRPDLVYIADRVRNLADINGKSANMNHALAKIFPPGTPISLDEVSSSFPSTTMACSRRLS